LIDDDQPSVVIEVAREQSAHGVARPTHGSVAALRCRRLEHPCQRGHGISARPHLPDEERAACQLGRLTQDRHQAA
jgi:hypothetical protein